MPGIIMLLTFCLPFFISFSWNRKIELYEMGWNLKDGLRDCLVAAAPYGGPIGEFWVRSAQQILVIYIIIYDYISVQFCGVQWHFFLCQLSSRVITDALPVPDLS